MEKFFITKESQTNQDGLIHPLKVTSLLYLKEALADEAYERCAELIRTARQFGAGSFEIQKVIQDHIRLRQKGDGKTVYMIRKSFRKP